MTEQVFLVKKDVGANVPKLEVLAGLAGLHTLPIIGQYQLSARVCTIISETEQIYQNGVAFRVP